MNPQVDKYLNNIEQGVEALGRCLEAKREAVEAHEEKHQQLLREYWDRRQRLSALDANTAQYEALEAENQRLQTTQHQLRDRLTALLTLVKSLTGHLRQ